jgi:hypothetical protein
MKSAKANSIEIDPQIIAQLSEEQSDDAQGGAGGSNYCSCNQYSVTENLS